MTKVIKHRESYKAYTWSANAAFQEESQGKKVIVVEVTATPIPDYDLSKVDPLAVLFLCIEFQKMVKLLVQGHAFYGCPMNRSWHQLQLEGYPTNRPFPPLLLDQEFKPSKLTFSELKTGKPFVAMREVL